VNTNCEMFRTHTTHVYVKERRGEIKGKRERKGKREGEGEREREGNNNYHFLYFRNRENKKFV